MGFISKEEFLGGTFAGLVKVFVSQPFDNTKFRMQGATIKMGLFQTIKVMMAESPLTFYKGMLSPLAGVGLAVSIQFGTSKTIKKYLLTSNSKIEKNRMTNVINFIAGAFAGIFNTCVITPVEHIRIKKAHPHPKEIYRGSGEALKRIMKEYGLKGLYKGQFITTIRESISYGMFFMMYDIFIKYLSPCELGRSEKPSALTSLTAGGLTGIVMWLIIYPIDIIKTRIQLDSLANPKYIGGVVQVYKEISLNGYLSFYHGFQPVLIRAVPVNAFTFAAYEFAYDKLKNGKIM